MYPEWAIKFKTKGTILRKKDEKSSYLFKVHSERQEGKKYPVLVQDELIGTISKDGIKYNNNRIVDVSNLTILPFREFSLFKKLINDEEKALFSNTYLLKIKNKWFFSKLNDCQIRILISKNIYWDGGLDENDGLFF